MSIPALMSAPGCRSVPVTIINNFRKTATAIAAGAQNRRLRDFRKACSAR